MTIRYYLFLLLFILCGACLMVFASEEDLLVACDTYYPLTNSGADIRISEVWFDGTDEWVEITNIGNDTFSGTLVFSGFKSSVFSKKLFIEPTTNIIIGDTLSGIQTDFMITGAGLSLPDTTGFTLTLLSGTDVLDTTSFTKETIYSIPNNEGLTMMWSGFAQREITPLLDTSPGFLLCNNTLALIPQILQDNVDIPVTPDFFNDIIPPDQFIDTNTNEIYLQNEPDIIANNIYENLDVIPQSTPSFTGETLGSGFDITEEDIGDELFESSILEDIFSSTNSGDDTHIPSGDSGYIETMSGDTDITIMRELLSGQAALPLPHPCQISEIFALSQPYAEYIELYCAEPFSGNIVFAGLGVGDTLKTISLQTTGGYHIITSIASGLNLSLPILLIQGLSLRDAGEIISMTSSGYIPLIISYPSLSQGQSYYPMCDTDGCILSPSPGTPQPIVSTPNPIVTSIPPSVLGDATTPSTYYQTLYQKRKNTAEEHQKTISTLKKSIQTLTKNQLQATKTQNKASSTQKSASTPKSTKPSSKSTIATTAKKSSPKLPKATSTKPISPKPAKSSSSTKGMISTTSKSYQLLLNEHKAYKSYATFIDSYLKNRLYKQYSSLKLDEAPSTLRESLAYIRQNKFTIYSGSMSGMSVFDFSSRFPLQATPSKKITTTFWQTGLLLYDFYKNLKNTLLLEKGTSNHTLKEGKNQSKNDTSNDTMAIKISEMSSLPLE